MKTKNIARHGDVLIRRVLDINGLTSSGSEEKQNFVKVEKITLAEGEVTGHHHELIPENTATLEVLTADNIEDVESSNFNVNELAEAIFQVKGGRGVLTHQEHNPIVLEEGVYIKRIQRELDPFENRIRKVMD